MHILRSIVEITILSDQIITDLEEDLEPLGGVELLAILEPGEVGVLGVLDLLLFVQQAEDGRVVVWGRGMGTASVREEGSHAGSWREERGSLREKVGSGEESRTRGASYQKKHDIIW